MPSKKNPAPRRFRYQIVLGIFIVDFSTSKRIAVEYEIVHDTSTHGDYLDYFKL